MPGVNKELRSTSSEVAQLVWLKKHRKPTLTHNEISYILGRSQAACTQKLGDYNRYLRGEEVSNSDIHEKAKRLLVSVNSGNAQDLVNKWKAPIFYVTKKSRYSYEDLLKYKKYAELMEWIYQNEPKIYDSKQQYRLELADQIKEAMGLLDV